MPRQPAFESTMVGHGSPQRRDLVVTLGRAIQRALGVVLAVCALSTGLAWGETARLTISWGGGASRVWHGEVTVDRGTLSQPVPLGIEADEPGSMWVQEGTLFFRQRSARNYDACLLTVDAPSDALLTLRLVPVDGVPIPFEVPMSEAIEKGWDATLDTQGNRISIRRQPGDRLRVEVKHPSLVFGPGETLDLDVYPQLSAVEIGPRTQIAAYLLGSDGESTRWRGEQDYRADDPRGVSLRVPLPREEGVYDLVIMAVRNPRLRRRMPRPALAWNQPLAERTVQLVVIDSEPPETPVLDPDNPEQDIEVVAEIDPTNLRWRDALGGVSQLPRLKRIGKGPLGTGDVQEFEHPLGRFIRLGGEATDARQAWEAYTLPIRHVGSPHLLEIEYPSDLAQSLGVSLVEPNQSGAFYPMGLDSGVDVVEPLLDDGRAPVLARHRVVFWPRTKSPMVLIHSQRKDTPAVYGRIRVKSGWSHLPRAFHPADAPRGRSFFAYMDRPLVPESFGAAESEGLLSDLGVDDWNTFHQGGVRLVEYLNHVGYNGLVLSVLTDGSTIYPSRRLEPTPRYDTGAFLRSGEDPVRKDVLEMLLRLFDREGLELIPALDFSAPLPELESALRHDGALAAGVRWVGPDGRCWTDANPRHGPTAPYYNVLNDHVQKAILDVVGDLARRYADHPSFAGVALQLSADGYAQLLPPTWGMDDVTASMFSRDTGIPLPQEGPQRFADRARLLTTAHADAWLGWRAWRLRQFHDRLVAEIRDAGCRIPLYLTGARMFEGEQLRRHLAPSLPRRLSYAETLLQVGIDPSRYAGQEDCLLLHAQAVPSGGDLAAQAAHLELAYAHDVAAVLRSFPRQGVLFYHPPHELRLASFDEASPFQPAYTYLSTELAPSGEECRRRFVHALATADSRVMVDGSWRIPLGREEALRTLIAMYRGLPDVPFRRIESAAGTPSGQPVTARFASQADGTYVYLVNDAPFPVRATLRVTASSDCRLEDLAPSGRFKAIDEAARGGTWSRELEAYDLAAFRLTDTSARVSGLQVSWSDRVDESLQARLDDLNQRFAALRGKVLDDRLENADFEMPSSGDTVAPGWSLVCPDSTAAELDSTATSGTQSLRLSSEGPAISAVSSPFSIPHTGRVTISLWLGMRPASTPLPLHLTVFGKHRGQDVSWYVPLGDQVGNAGAVRTSAAAEEIVWRPVVVPINDLPLSDLASLRLRFDLIGSGEVWIDALELRSMEFSRDERLALMKMIGPAQYSLQNGQVSDCLRLLNDYWARFLTANVTPSGIAVSSRDSGVRHEPPPDEEKTKLLDRVRRRLPKLLMIPAPMFRIFF